jgi:hypothetical protein
VTHLLPRHRRLTLERGTTSISTEMVAQVCDFSKSRHNARVLLSLLVSTAARAMEVAHAL